MTAPDVGQPARRTVRRAATIAEIKSHAREQLAATGGLSLRGIAREMGMSPAALFRYFDGQDALITALCVDAYDGLADALTTAAESAATPTDGWRALCCGARDWARTNPAAFALIHGTPVPGYHARSDETGPSAGRVMLAVASAYLAAVESGEADPAVTGVPAVAAGPLLISLSDASSVPDSPVTAIVLNAWASILGFIAAEAFGSLDRLVADGDLLFEAHVRTVMRGMGFQSLPDIGC